MAHVSQAFYHGLQSVTAACWGNDMNVSMAVAKNVYHGSCTLFPLFIFCLRGCIPD